jgi:hypothetical protein
MTSLARICPGRALDSSRAASTTGVPDQSRPWRALSPTEIPTRIWSRSNGSLCPSRWTARCISIAHIAASATECSNTAMRPSPRFLTSTPSLRATASRNAAM